MALSQAPQKDRRAPCREQVRVGARAHPGRGEGPGGAARAPSFVRDAPGATRRAYTLPPRGRAWGRARRDWPSGRPPLAEAPHAPRPQGAERGCRLPGACCPRGSHAPPEWLRRRGGRHTSPQRRTRRGAYPGPVNGSFGEGAAVRTRHPRTASGGRTGGLLGTGTRWGPEGCARGTGCGLRRLTARSLQTVRQGLGEERREGEAREGGREKGGGGAEEGYLDI